MFYETLLLYLVSGQRVASSLQVLDVVWHSEFHPAVFVGNNPFLAFLHTVKQIPSSPFPGGRQTWLQPLVSKQSPVVRQREG